MFPGQLARGRTEARSREASPGRGTHGRWQVTKRHRRGADSSQARAGVRGLGQGQQDLGPFPHRTGVLWDQGPTLMTLFNQNHLQRPSLQIHHTVGPGLVL